MKIITSLQNEIIKHIVKLHNAKYRHEQKQFIAQGFITCSTLIERGYKLHEIYLIDEKHTQYEKQFGDKPMTIVSDQVMAKISTTATPSGIVAVFEIPSTDYTPTSNALVLHNIQDPGNMGTLIRSAAAMNIQNVFIIEGTDPYSPKVVQATAGAISYITIVPISWQQFAHNHKNISTCALVVEGGQTPQALDLSGSILIVGNEGQGLPSDVIQACNQRLTIPMPGKTESINAAVAGSIALYLKSMNSK